MDKLPPLYKLSTSKVNYYRSWKHLLCYQIDLYRTQPYQMDYLPQNIRFMLPSDKSRSDLIDPLTNSLAYSNAYILSIPYDNETSFLKTILLCSHFTDRILFKSVFVWVRIY